MVTWRPVYFLWGAILLVIAALSAAAWLEHSRAAELSSRLTALTAVAQRRAFESSGAVVVKDVPKAPAVPSQVRNQVDAVQRAVPEAKVERTEVLQTGEITAHGKVLPCEQVPPHAAAGSPGASASEPEGGAEQRSGDNRGAVSASAGASGGALLRVGDRFFIRVATVTLDTEAGAEGLVGEGELIRFDGESLGRGAILNSASTVTRRQRPQERPAWFAVPMGGVTSRARAWAGVAIGRGRWGGVLAGAWKPGDAEVFVGGSARF